MSLSQSIIDKILANKLIQHAVEPGETIFAEPSGYEFKRIEVDMLNGVDQELMTISRSGQLFLNLEEMKTMRQVLSAGY